MFVARGYETDFNSPAVVMTIVVNEDFQTLRFGANGRNDPANIEDSVGISVYADDKRSRIGLHARGLWLEYMDGQGPGGRSGEKFFIPWLRFFRYRSLKLGMRGTYRGRPVIILGKRPEVVRS